MVGPNTLRRYSAYKHNQQAFETVLDMNHIVSLFLLYYQE